MAPKRPASATHSKLETLVWVAAAAAIVIYGNGERNLLQVLAFDARVDKLFSAFGVINMLANGLLFIYVYVILGGVFRVKDPLHSGTLAVPMGGVTLVSTVVGFIVALWPVFKFLAILQVLVVTWGTICFLTLLPGVGILKSKRPRKQLHED